LARQPRRSRSPTTAALASAVARFTTDPRRELQELVLRDVLDVSLGNSVGS